MTDKKFTDEEVTKTLERCGKGEGCYRCAKEYMHSADCIRILNAECLDLINRQKAENEKLNIELKAMRGAANSYKAEVERLKKENKILSHNADTAFQDGLNESRELFAPEIKAEAYKEFAKFLIDKSSKGLLRTSDLPDYVKEMVGEEE